MKSISQLGIHAQPKSKSAECDQHGKFESKCFIGSIWTKCPICDAERAQREAADEEARERESRRSAWHLKIGQSGIPARFKERTLQNFVAVTDAQRRALAFAKQYADEFDHVMTTGRCALFIGKPGTGKTHLAAGIGLQVMRDQNRTVLFTTVMRAIRRVKDSWTKGSTDSESKAIEALTFPDLLILDEIGVQAGSEFEKLTLFDVLNERYEKRKPTILISNLSASDVKNYLGDRVIDRLREDGGKSIAFDWESYRGKARA